MSAKEIKQTADKIIRKEIKNERNRQRENQDLNLTAKVLIMNRLGDELLGRRYNYYWRFFCRY